MNARLYRLRALALLAAALALTAVLLSGDARQTAPNKTLDAQRAAPEGASGRRTKVGASAQRYMVAAAHPLAVDAGLQMLRAGGSAIDAAIAVQLVLNLVEPQSSGIGGGAFILHWNEEKKSLTSYDARETAPMAATPDRFVPKDGAQPDWPRTVHSGLSVGVPGLLRGLELAHAQHGRLAWARLFEPAIAIAVEGFAVTRRLNLLLNTRSPGFFDETSRAYFFRTSQVLGGSRWAVRPGTRLKNPEFAALLKRIARDGAGVFYRGDVAEAIVAAVRQAPNAAGDMTLADLAGYKAIERTPVCVRYRGYKVCGMGPPSSGALTVGQVLILIEPFDLGTTPLNTVAVHRITEAQTLAFADRDRYMADADFIPVPKALLDPAYLASRRKLIRDDAVIGKAGPGAPPLKSGAVFGRDATRELPGTSHISIVDEAGNAVSMTTTIESAFGSRLMVKGFLLNNELTDFAWTPRDESGNARANRVEPGKRPRSSMSPTIIFAPDGKLWALTGSPGGSRIILYTLKSIIGLIDWKLSAQAAADLPNFGSRNTGVFEAETGLQASKIFAGAKLLAAMKLRGHAITPGLMVSGVHTIVVRAPGVLEGGADPRRDGVARGD